MPGYPTTPTEATTPWTSAPSSARRVCRSVKYILEHIASLVLPFTVLVVVPALVERRWQLASGWQLTVGILLLLIGLLVMALTIASFARIGRGTLAPWRPGKSSE